MVIAVAEGETSMCADDRGRSKIRLPLACEESDTGVRVTMSSTSNKGA